MSQNEPAGVSIYETRMVALAASLPETEVSLDAALAREFEERLADCPKLAYRVALGVLRNTAEAENVAQDAVLRAYRNFDRLRDRERFRGWIARTAWRLALDRIRATGRREIRESASAGTNPWTGVEAVVASREFERPVPQRRLLNRHGNPSACERMKTMKLTRLMLVSAAVLLLAAPSRAQQKSGDAAPPDSTTAYRVQIIVSEYDGAAKIGSLPYTIPVAQVGDPAVRGSLRVGIRVPINTSTKSGESQIQYADVGTNLDVRVRRGDSDRYALELTLERSSLYVREQNKDGKVEGRAWAPGDPAPSLAPVYHQFRANMEFLVRDGRNGDTAVITDPVTGHVLKVDAALSVLR